jgi:hypothetical protein
LGRDHEGAQARPSATVAKPLFEDLDLSKQAMPTYRFFYP